jgi:aryl-alcohol dehydrogenase-like predicted oxidoreductase
VDYRRLGRTGIHVSVLGLGTGGANRFGQGRGAAPGDARALVHAALDLGVNFFDTAHAYGLSEDLLGAALQGVPRSSYHLATKYTFRDPAGALISPAAVHGAIELSLRRLRVDLIDVVQIHALTSAWYHDVVERHLPVLVRARDAGMVRAIGVTESFAGDDPAHEMLDRALREKLFDTVMVGYNVLNQNAEWRLLPLAQAADIGVIVMAAVRRVLRSTAALEELIAELKSAGHVAADAVPDTDPLGWLVEHGASSVPAACYRYVLDSPAISTVLTGTFDLAHLRENVRAVERGPLPPADRDRLRAAFGHLDMGLGR